MLALNNRDGYTEKVTRVVAVLGASCDRRKFGNKAVRAFHACGFDVVPINLNESMIEGLRVYSSVLDVECHIDMATVYLEPSIGVIVLDELVKKGVNEVWLNPGADDITVVTRARALGLKPIVGCSIVGIGESPSSYE